MSVYFQSLGQTAVTDVQFFCDFGFWDTGEEHLVDAVDIDVFAGSAEFDTVGDGLDFSGGTSVTDQVAFVFA